MINPHPAVRILHYLDRDDQFEREIKNIEDDPDFQSAMQEVQYRSETESRLCRKCTPASSS